MQQAFWNSTPADWFIKLHSNEKGLTDEQAGEKLKQTSSHIKRAGRFVKGLTLFMNQLKSPLTIMLIVAVVLSAFLGQLSDALIITFIILSTSILSFVQEYNAGRVVEKLQSLIAHSCTVMRNGMVKDIPSAGLVPGDIIMFRAGDIVPADCLIIEATNVQANEASLTGESFPVNKAANTITADAPLAKRTNCLWEGSNIVSGSAKALVIQTGADTIFGSISKSAGAPTETAFEKGIKKFGYFLLKVTVALSIFILGVNLLFHRPVVDSLLFALALAVGMAPELLPAITTIAMSAGARRMLGKKVIVKKLSSIQNLGEITLLCTDKTGTITEGIITVEGSYDLEGQKSDFTQKLAYINASLQSAYANPIDDALRQLNEPTEPTQKLAEIPYDFTRKRLGLAVKEGNNQWLICKGAVRNIVSICTQLRMTDGSVQPIDAYLTAINDQYAAYGNMGLRVIGVCYKTIDTGNASVEDERDMIFAGFVALQDPVKQGIPDTLAELTKLEVGLKIITGDNKNVALNIAKSIGIKDPVVMASGEMDAMNADVLAQKAKDTHIFAEVEPHQKENIINLLKKSYTVAYIGDGINDVGAITAADVGISVNNAVDIAKEAADFVLMEKDLMVLCDGIREGRKTFANTLKYIFINTGATFGNMFSVAAASLILPFLPMLAKQILLTNFLTDFPYLAVASDNVDDEQIQKPGKWDIGLIRKYMVYFGIHSSAFDILTFLWLMYAAKAVESTFQTGWFIESVLTELLILFIMRTRKAFFKSTPGKYLFILSVLALVLTIALPYLPFAGILGLVPLNLPTLAAMLGIVMLYALTGDWLKIWFFKRYAQN